MSTFSKLNANRTLETPFAMDGIVSDLGFVANRTLGIVSVPSKEFLYDFVVLNQNLTNWGIIFDETNDPVPNIQYQIWFNSTTTSNQEDIFSLEILALMRGLDESIISSLNDPTGVKTANFNVTMKTWPRGQPKTLSDGVVSTLGGVFFLCSTLFIFVNALDTILMEKELFLRSGMHMAGLKSSAYWIGHFLSFSLICLGSTIGTLCLGLAFGFQLFRKTDGRILFLTFFMLGESMVSLAFLLSVFVPNRKIGVFVGMFVFIIAILFQSFIFSSGLFGYIWWKTSTPAFLRGTYNFTIVFSILPFFNFGKIILDLATLTTGALSIITGTYTSGPGATWPAFFVPVPKNLLPIYPDGISSLPPAPVQSIWFMLMDTVIFLALTFYLDKVIPDQYGTRLHPLFFIKMSYWITDNDKIDEKVWSQDVKSGIYRRTPTNLREDVISERSKTLDPSNLNSAIKIMHLRKCYKDKSSVKDMCITLNEDDLFVLLGQNGAVNVF